MAELKEHTNFAHKERNAFNRQPGDFTHQEGNGFAGKECLQRVSGLSPDWPQPPVKRPIPEPDPELLHVDPVLLDPDPERHDPDLELHQPTDPSGERPAIEQREEKGCKDTAAAGWSLESVLGVGTAILAIVALSITGRIALRPGADHAWD